MRKFLTEPVFCMHAKREPLGVAEPIYESWYRLMKAARISDNNIAASEAR